MKRWSKVWHVALAFVLLFSFAGMALAEKPEDHPGKGQGKGQVKQMAKAFKDMEEAAWANEFVEKMQEKGLLSGYPDGKFRPNKPVTQGEVLTIAVRIAGLEGEAANIQAEAGAGKHWAYGAIEVATDQGWVEAKAAIRPEKAASRWWTVDVLSNVADLELLDSDTEIDIESLFDDVDDVPPYIQKVLEKAVANGYINGYPGGKFQPNKPVTRAELSAILCRIDEDIDFDTIQWGKYKGTVTSVAEDVYDSVTDEVYGTVIIELDHELEFDIAASLVIHEEDEDNERTVADLQEGDRVTLFVRAGEVTRVILHDEAEEDEAEEVEDESEVEEDELTVESITQVKIKVETGNTNSTTIYTSAHAELIGELFEGIDFTDEEEELQEEIINIVLDHLDLDEDEVEEVEVEIEFSNDTTIEFS